MNHTRRSQQPTTPRRGITPSERAEEHIAIQRRLKQDAAERRALAQKATRDGADGVEPPSVDRGALRWSAPGRGMR